MTEREAWAKAWQQAWKRYEKLKAQAQELRDHDGPDAKRLNKAYEKALKSAWRESGHKGRYTAEKALEDLDEATIDRLKKPFLVEMEELWKQNAQERRELVKSLGILAPEVEVPTTRTWALFETFHVSTYSTQTAQESYTEGRAELEAWRLTRAGFKARVCKQEDAYLCEVRVAKRNLPVLRFLPLTTLKEDIAWCWSRVLNPRVFWPLIPQDFEEKHGIGRTAAAAKQFLKNLESRS